MEIPNYYATVAEALRLNSPAIQDGLVIPKKYIGEGDDLSPPLIWSALPRGTKSVALICDDPDAPSEEPWVHWVIYNISVSQSTGLPEGLLHEKVLHSPVRAFQGKNSSGKIGYYGPIPPSGHGSHRYFFKLYALDSELPLGPGATKKELLTAMNGHILSQAQLMGRYERR